MLADLAEILLWNTLVSSFAIMLVLALRKPILNRFGARIAYLLWSIVPIVMMAAMLPASEHVVSMQRLVLDAEPGLSMPVVMAKAGVMSQTIDMRKFLLLVWVAGCAIFAIAMIVQQRRFIAALGALNEREKGIHYAANASSSPALIGLFPARIVLPSDFDTLYEGDERELIIRHERIHHDRGDHWFNALVAGLRCIFWFNPLIHAAAAVFRQDQELACDALVVAANPQSRRAYASAMLKAGLQAAPLPVGCQWRSMHPLKERVLMLQRAEIAPTCRRIGIAILAAMAVSASFAAWAMQPATSAERIEVELRFSGGAGNGEVVKRAVLKVDESVSVEVGQGARRKTLEIAFRSVSPGRIFGAGVVRVGGNIFSTPQILFEDGKPVSMSIEDDNNGDFAVPAKHWEINVTARVLNAPAVAPHVDGVRGDEKASAGVDVMPRYARIRPPLHPTNATGARMTGTVYLFVRVGRDGSPLGIERLKVEPESLTSAVSDRLVDAAIDAVRAWTFDPAERNGEKVEGSVIVPIKFGGDDSSASDSKLSGAENALDTILVNEL